MDLGGRPEPDLSLGLHARASPRSPIADDSISLQTDPTLRDATRSTTPLHLFDHQSESRRAPDNDPDAAPLENGDDEEHAEEEEEEAISILGYTMSVKKRRRRGDSTSSSCSPLHHSKRPAVEPPPSLPPPDRRPVLGQSPTTLFVAGRASAAASLATSPLPSTPTPSSSPSSCSPSPPPARSTASSPSLLHRLRPSRPQRLGSLR